MWNHLHIDQMDLSGRQAVGVVDRGRVSWQSSSRECSDRHVCKCASTWDAWFVFQQMRKRDIVVWKTMILGPGMTGHARHTGLWNYYRFTLKVIWICEVQSMGTLAGWPGSRAKACIGLEQTVSECFWQHQSSKLYFIMFYFSVWESKKNPSWYFCTILQVGEKRKLVLLHTYCFQNCDSRRKL
jgi:hypothetical protein